MSTALFFWTAGGGRWVLRENCRCAAEGAADGCHRTEAFDGTVRGDGGPAGFAVGVSGAVSEALGEPGEVGDGADIPGGAGGSAVRDHVQHVFHGGRGGDRADG